MAAVLQPTEQKLLGAYYTPPLLADFLASWAIETPRDRVLEPACGDAVFLLAAARRLRALGTPPSAAAAQLTAFDLDATAAHSAAAALAEELRSPSRVSVGDFFRQSVPPEHERFDAAVGNPPWIRYHLFEGDTREQSQALAKAAGVAISGLASSWAAFVVHASSFLKPEGRLGFVLPAELLTTDYAEPIRDFLTARFGTVHVITFKERVFPGALVDAVLLLASGRGPGAVAVTQLRNASGITGLKLAAPSAQTRPGKWSRLLVPTEAVVAYDAAAPLPGVTRLGEAMAVDIGVVTGANAYFVVDRDTRAKFGLEQVTERAVPRPTQLTGTVYREADWLAAVEGGEPAWLFTAEELTDDVRRYVEHGEAIGANRAYKCRVRGEKWWRLRRFDPPDFLLSYMAHRAPRFAANEARASSTNLVHQVRATRPVPASNAVAAGFYNSLTLLSAEIEGRTYGGGVLKLETKEAERLLLPLGVAEPVWRELAERAGLVDSAVRQNQVEAALDLVDPILLGKGLGLSAEDRRALRAGWEVMRSRRALRGRSRP